MSAPDVDRNGIQVISRAAAILRSLEAEPNGLSLGAIARRIDLPRSTVQRLVDALALEQLLDVRGAGGVRLGPALMRLAARSHVDISQVAQPFLEVLSRQTGETAALVHASGSDLIILHSEVSHQELRVCASSSSFLTVYGSSGGKVLLANMEDAAVIALLEGQMRALTPHTLNLAQLLAELAQIRQEGFGYDRQEQIMGVGAVGIGVSTSQGNYAISLVGPAWRVEVAHEPIKKALRTCQQGLIAALSNIA